MIAVSHWVISYLVLCTHSGHDGFVDGYASLRGARLAACKSHSVGMAGTRDVDHQGPALVCVDVWEDVSSVGGCGECVGKVEDETP